jgi:hypothetical protein
MKNLKSFSAAARAFLVLTLLLTALPLLAKARKGQENRFLFIVNTSSALKKYYNAEIEDVVELLGSNMHGELREGDTLGLWTYDEILHPEYPMQVWSRDDKSAIMTEMAAYLRGRRYDLRGHLEKIGPALNDVIKASERLTIILIFDGTTPVHGTPFDVEINMLQKKYARELKAERKPFVLVLVSREGIIDDFTINYPGPISIPHTAIPEPIETNKPPVTAVAPAPETIAPVKQPEGPSIFISGRKTTSATAGTGVLVTTTAPPPVTSPVIVATIPSTPPPSPVVQPQPPRPAPAVAPTPAPAPVQTVAATPPAPVVTPTPMPVASTAQSTAQSAPQPAPAPAVATTAPSEPPQNPEPAKEAAPPDKEWTQPKAAAIAAATPSSGAPVGLFVMASLLLIVAVVLVVFLLRRGRPAPQSSLITQTIERPRPR